MPPEENARTRIITIKDAHIESLKIEAFRQKSLVIRNLTLKKCQIHYQVAAGKEIMIIWQLYKFYFPSIFYSL